MNDGKDLLIASGMSQEKPLFLWQLADFEGPDWEPVMNSFISALVL